ncbi:MAG: helix-turn-helix domain-containing protein [Firmicutes bacterium]|nr:helix-turn-helix domain-containing protein [Bacillota bacterium]
MIGKESELIGRRIKEARHKLGLTQEELGDRANLHYSYIGQLERGNKVPSLKTLKKIASALNIRLEVLLEDNPDRDLSPQQLLVQELVSTVKNSSPEDIRMYIKIIRHIQNRMRDHHSRRQEG